MDDGFSTILLDDFDEDESEIQMKTVSLEEYKRLVQLIPDVEKYRNAAQKKDEIIKLKDAQLKEIQKSLQLNWINVSHLTTVSVLVFLLLLRF